MPNLKRIVLDVLKPHEPNALEFAQRIAAQTPCTVHLTVVAVDDKTQSVAIEIRGKEIDYPSVTEAITLMGGSIHSIDDVEVSSTA